MNVQTGRLRPHNYRAKKHRAQNYRARNYQARNFQAQTYPAQNYQSVGCERICDDRPHGDLVRLRKLGKPGFEEAPRPPIWSTSSPRPPAS